MEIGLRDGLDEGLLIGWLDGFDEGFEEGFDDGLELGLRDGLDEGCSGCSTDSMTEYRIDLTMEYLLGCLMDLINACFGRVA